MYIFKQVIKARQVPDTLTPESEFEITVCTWLGEAASKMSSKLLSSFDSQKRKLQSVIYSSYDIYNIIVNNINLITFGNYWEGSLTF